MHSIGIQTRFGHSNIRGDKKRRELRIGHERQNPNAGMCYRFIAFPAIVSKHIRHFFSLSITCSQLFVVCKLCIHYQIHPESA